MFFPDNIKNYSDTTIFNHTVSISSVDAFVSQLLFVECSIILFASAINFKKRRRVNNSISNSRERRAIYITSVIVGFIVIPVSIWYSLSIAIVSIKHGYASLYYGDYVLGGIPWLINMAFLPCLIGLLIGSNYKKEYADLYM